MKLVHTGRYDAELLELLKASASKAGHTMSRELHLRLWRGLASDVDENWAREAARTSAAWQQ